MKQAFEKPTLKRTDQDIEQDLGYDDVLKTLKEGPVKDRTVKLLKYDDLSFLKGLLAYLGPGVVPFNKMNPALKKRWMSARKKKDAPQELVSQISDLLQKQKEYHTQDEEKPPMSKWQEIEDKAKEMMSKDELPEEEKARRMEIYKSIKQEKAFDLAYRLYKKNLVAESQRLLRNIVAYEEPAYKPSEEELAYLEERRKKRRQDDADMDKHSPRVNPFKSDKERDKWLDSITGKPEEKKPKKKAEPKSPPVPPKIEAPKPAPPTTPAKKPQLTIQPVRTIEPPDPKKKAEPKKMSKEDRIREDIRLLEKALVDAKDQAAKDEIQQFIDEEKAKLGSS